MNKKSFSTVDLRITQSKSKIQSTPLINKINSNNLDDFEFFDIPIEGEDINLQSLDNSNNNKNLSFDLPIDTFENKVQKTNTLGFDEINFIPKSAKNYKKRFFTNKDLIYATKSSFIIFLSICIVVTISLPSLTMINKALRVKDNLLLQASASEKLLSNTSSDNLKNLTASLNEISKGINKNSKDIADIQGNLSILLSILPGLSIIQNSSEVTKSVSEVIAITADLSEAIEPFVTKEINPFDKDKQITLVDGVKKIKEVNQKLVPALENLSNNLNDLPINLIPGHKGDIIKQLNIDIPKLRQIIIESDPYIDIFLNFVGSDILRRYVFIFQNNQELRATGGFIGSFGMMNIDKGIVKSLDIKEIYNPDGQLLKQILAPKPLQELTTKWYLRDSNWFADFPTSAQKIISFYEKTGGATPDGVISLTPTVIERLLLITGPIKLENYGVTINADNFLKITQYQTGVAYDKVENKPKQFIADLAPILINKLLSSDASQYQKIVEALNNSFQEKHILLYFLDPVLQDIVDKYNLGGKIYDAPKDYLSVVHSNIGGYKTDGVMQEGLDISSKFQNNGKITNKIIISREHKGGNAEYDWWNKDNINYMRVYIPKNSKILNASGYTDKEEKNNAQNIASYIQDKDLKAINDSLVHNEDWDIDLFEESGKLVIGGWVITQPGNTSQVMIEYELPFTFKKYDIYSLILQKQAGILGVKYKYNFEILSKNKIIWQQSSFDNIEFTEKGYNVSDTVFKTDEYIGLQIK
jgi:hypothetical protein